MLCQQAINILEEAASTGKSKKFACQWNRDEVVLGFWIKKVRQLLYHLIFSVIQTASTGSLIHIHVSHKDNELNLPRFPIPGWETV